MRKWFIIIALLLIALPTRVFAANMTVTWEAPTTNEDGSPLTDLAGYKVYYGTDSNSYQSVVDVGDVLTYSLIGLDEGTYYIAVTAYDTSANESDYSNEVSKVIVLKPSAPIVVEVIVTVYKDGNVKVYIVNK